MYIYIYIPMSSVSASNINHHQLQCALINGKCVLQLMMNLVTAPRTTWSIVNTENNIYWFLH